MRYITESELRERFAGGAPGEYRLPDGARLTPAARQYLSDLRLYSPQDEERAMSAAPCSAKGAPCSTSDAPCSAPGARKPEHMTHLTRTRLVCKTDPRIELRGRLDSLEAELLLVQIEAPPAFERPLADALALAQRVLAADVKQEPLGDWRLDGMTAEEVRAASHRPEAYGFGGHIRLGPEHGRFAALMNRLRAQTRECELCAVRAFWRDGALEREDLVLALNRLSSYFYVLELRAAASAPR